MCPGMISLYELAMPMSGRSISSSVRPMALRRDRCGYFSRPYFINLLRTFGLLCFTFAGGTLRGLGLDVVNLKIFRGKAVLSGHHDFAMILLLQVLNFFAFVIKEEVGHVFGGRHPHFPEGILG